MTNIFLEINGVFIIIKSMTYNLRTKSHKIDTEKSKLGKKYTFLVHQSLQYLHSTIVF